MKHKFIEVETSEYSFNPVRDLIPDEPFMTGGRQLQIDLGLKNFGKNVYIQKIIGIALPVYIITYNSKYPKVLLPIMKVKQIKSTWPGKIKRKGIHVFAKKIKLTPPIPLISSLVNMTTGSIVIMRDIAGEYLRQPRVFECVEINNKLKLVESK